MTTTERFLALRAPVQASVSADGDRLAVTVTWVEPGSTEASLALLVVGALSGAPRPVAGVSAGDHWGVFGPDGSLAWCGERDGRDVVLVSGPAAGAADGVADGGPAVFDVGSTASPPVWSPDGTRLCLAVHRGVRVDRSQPWRWTRPVQAFDGYGPLEDPPQLLVLDLTDGSSSWLTDDGWRWGAPVWSPAGDAVAAPVSLDPEGRLGGTHLRVVGLDGGVSETAVPAGRSVTIAWSGEELLALVAEPVHLPVGAAPRLWRLAGGRPESAAEVAVVFPDAPATELLGDVYGDQPAELADDPARVLLPLADGSYVVRTGRRGRMGIARLAPDASGGFRGSIVLDGDRCASPVGVAAGRVWLTDQAADRPVDLFSLSLDEPEPLHPVTRFTAPGPAGAAVRRTTVAAEGRELDVWFLGGSDRPVPTVVLVHGGPQFAYGEAFNLDAQALVDAGFGVLYTNVRGSTGYGDEFGGAVVGDWAEGPTRDLMAVVDHAVALGWADPERLGVAGNSYGGYLASWLASTSTRFKAAVAENPVTDLVSMASTSDIAVPFFAQQMGGELHEIPAVYLAQSPVTQAHRCRTPILFVIGTDDRRCPNHQAWGMHRLVHRTGTPTEVLVLPRSTHEGSTYGPIPGRLAHDAALVDWMTRHLL
ncbi:MAG: prolyl oligopeptidase family serine peptidase [Nocardioidaceae bacterium]